MLCGGTKWYRVWGAAFLCLPLDIRLPDKNGLDILGEMLIIANPPKVIMMTAFQDMETTIEAMKSGAYEYLNKPLNTGEIERTVDRSFRYSGYCA